MKNMYNKDNVHLWLGTKNHIMDKRKDVQISCHKKKSKTFKIRFMSFEASTAIRTKLYRIDANMS